MTPKPRLFKIGKAKLPLFLLGILILLGIAINLIPKTKNTTQVRLTSFENKFIIDFKVTPKDLPKFESNLEKLNIDKAVKNGVMFELDATASAHLALASPVEANLTFPSNDVTLRGVTQTSYLPQYPVFSIKIPKSTGLLMFSGKLSEVLGKNVKSPPINVWLKSNTSGNGQYFMIFGQDSNWAFIFNDANANLESLKDLKDVEYKKEESQEGTQYHLLKVQIDSKESETYVLFQKDDKLFLTLSLDSAKALTGVQTDQEESLNYPQNNLKEATFALLLLNEGNMDEKFLKYLFTEPNNLGKYLNKIKKFEFTLKQDEFSGLISIKNAH